MTKEDAASTPNEAEPASVLEAGLSEVEAGYQAAFDACESEHALREANAKIAGPEGELTGLLKLMRSVPKDRKREFGQRANAIKTAVGAAFDAALTTIAAQARKADLEGPPIDISLPARPPVAGSLHPLTQVKNDLLDIFSSLGFEVATGPEVDLYEYNFDKLGFPPDHPATDMQDSFFVRTEEPKTLLRTHTSTIQVRQMLERKPPLAVVSPGAVFRRDDDITHSPMFFQLEALLVDEGVSFADLKGTITRFVNRFFGDDVGVRLRPSYFPFVEPGAEVDIACVFCKPWEKDEARVAACRVCKGTGWIEVLGCGMVHPIVFERVGYDPERYTGFALGMGIDRLAMLRYGIQNIRLMYENDVRFLRQF